MAKNPKTSHKENPINNHRIKISLTVPILFRARERRRRPKMIPMPIATPVRDMIGMPAAKYFMPRRRKRGMADSRVVNG